MTGHTISMTNVDLELGCLRSGNDNPCFCGVHSSDDSVSVVREAKIFFGEQRLREAIGYWGATEQKTGLSKF